MSFLSKVLLPVLAFLVLLPLFTLWIVNRHMTQQVLGEARQRLATAEGVFINSLDIHAGHLQSRYNNVVNEPRFRAVARLADPRTMTAHLNELLREIGGDAEVMLFTTANGDMLAGAKRYLAVDLEEFYDAAGASIRQASRGQPSVTKAPVRGAVFHVVSVPVLVDGVLNGALSVAERLGDRVVQDLKLLTRTEILLLTGETIAASTVQDRDLHDSLVGFFSNHSSRPVILNREHFLATAGVLSGEGVDDLGFLLLSSYERQLRTYQDTRMALLWFSGIGIVVSAGLVWLLVRRTTRPLRELQAHAEAVGRGDFSRRIERFSNDECGDLAEAFNRMTANLNASRSELEDTVERLRAAQSQLVQSEKLSAVGQFVAGVTHELTNPLTSVIGFAELLRHGELSGSQRKYADHLFRGAERCQKIVQSLLSFSRQHSPERKKVGINALIDSVLEILSYEFRTNNIKVVREFSNALPEVNADPHQLEQVFLNLLTNARHALETNRNGRRIEIGTSAVNGTVQIVVRDNGPGIPPRDLSRIFDPFFTTKPIGEGTGLGLSLSYGIIEEHGGRIRVESRPGEGASFYIELPGDSDPGASNQAAEGAPGAIVCPSRRGGGRRVLVVDDEQPILDLIQAILEADGFVVDVSTDGDAALRSLASDTYDLVICDWKMPGRDGIEIFEKAVRTNPRAAGRFIFMTGNTIAEDFREFLHARKLRCVPKPFSIERLHQTIAALDEL